MMKLLTFILLPTLAMSFAPVSRPVVTAASSSLDMVPKFDGTQNKWLPASPEEGPEAGYDIWGSLLRQGPVPFFTRLISSEEYEQGVLKFMAGDKVDRQTGQAEMDGYLQNPADWTYNRLNGYTVDYLSLDNKKIALTLIWGTFITTLLGRGIYCAVTRDYYWDILNSSILS